MKPVTRDNMRYFKCKCCGFVHGEPLDKWRKKPQKKIKTFASIALADVMLAVGTQ